jgi:hypothetical protein
MCDAGGELVGEGGWEVECQKLETMKKVIGGHGRGRGVDSDVLKTNFSVGVNIYSEKVTSY